MRFRQISSSYPILNPYQSIIVIMVYISIVQTAFKVLPFQHCELCTLLLLIQSTLRASYSFGLFNRPNERVHNIVHRAYGAFSSHLDQNMNEFMNNHSLNAFTHNTDYCHCRLYNMFSTSFSEFSEHFPFKCKTFSSVFFIGVMSLYYSLSETNMNWSVWQKRLIYCVRNYYRGLKKTQDQQNAQLSLWPILRSAGERNSFNLS